MSMNMMNWPLIIDFSGLNRVKPFVMKLGVLKQILRNIWIGYSLLHPRVSLLEGGTRGEAMNIVQQGKYTLRKVRQNPGKTKEVNQ